MAEVRRITGGLGALTEIISDRSELAKGAQLFDGKQLTHLSRFENRLFADASGSGASPYKVSLVFGDGREVKGRCSCMAARSRPFCKHAAALLVAWARAPEAFVTADAAPSGGTDGARKKSVKKGKAESTDLMKAGVAQVSTLVRELGLSGVVSMGAERPEQVRQLGEALRANGLRRLAARTVEVAGLLDLAVARTGTFEAPVYTDLVADMLLTVRKVEKHLGGEALEDRYVEELIGRTWTKKDRAPVEGLTLVEYAFTTRATPDNFLIRESRFVDLASGKHYAEKQILPAFLRSVEPKKSHAGLVLEGAKGGQYPGFAPHRLDLETEARKPPLDGAALHRLLDVALPDVGAALTAFQEHRKDVFAPDLLPVTLRVETLLASGQRSQLVDSGDRGLFLPADAKLEEPLAAALEGARLRGVMGDIGLEAALPTLFPLALVVETPEGLELRGLGRPGDEATTSRRRGGARPAAAVAVPRSGWAESARAAGASRAAIALAEVRDELAEAFANGLPAVSTRAMEPLVARLRELGLEKPAALLETLAARPDAAERLDDFIKVYQVLGIALVRLAGAVQVDAGALRPVPTHPSIHVRKPEVPLLPGEALLKRARGELTRYEAAAHAAHYYASMDPDALLGELYPAWSDGAASTFVARAVAEGSREKALAVAKRALAEHHSRMVRRTAIRVLGLLGGPEARQLLDALTRKGHDAGLRLYAREVLEDVRARESGPQAVAALLKTRKERIHPHAQRALTESTKEARRGAVDQLEALGLTVAWPVLRQVLYGDPSRDVRNRAAMALAWLGDSEVLERFVGSVEARGGDDEEAKTATYALGVLGDVRGAETLLAAFVDGWKPGVVSESLRTFGLAMLHPTVRLAEVRPEAVERQALRNLFERFPADALTEVLLARVEASREHPEFIDRCGVYLKLAAENLHGAGKQVASALMAIPAVAGDKTLSRAAKKVLGEKA
ncbi:HEAT repeat domain-containing protein [Pyxidicoccus fallax]|uniref:HEAT repeat domain-containing protein n=1 Tax=Pyxidicoccus fallax TaxID=394095 RepID=A0A848LEK4_9BACT|nr:HEAT repeat domain-containing protein [Pyxidicoccus fallax]NMO16672.1 HEAT repeat domain-containing protein [Pyxidicoccus fallax]NPC79237.1 HEAT repeat domain-containing protein [Pyxidicoccus fallax]